MKIKNCSKTEIDVQYSTNAAVLTHHLLNISKSQVYMEEVLQGMLWSLLLKETCPASIWMTSGKNAEIPIPEYPSAPTEIA